MTVKNFMEWLEDGDEIITSTMTAGVETGAFSAEPTQKDSKVPKIKSKTIGIVDTGVADVTGEMSEPLVTTSYRNQTVATKNQKTMVGGDASTVATPRHTTKEIDVPDMYATGLFNVNFAPNK